jgi:hypothetical protein
VNQKYEIEMNRNICKSLVVAVFAVTVIGHADASVASKAIVVEYPSDLPEFAQQRIEAMYLQRNGGGQAILYLEQDRGRKLAMLDVSDPAHIRAIGQVSTDARSAYDFVQDMNGSAVLIHYRDHSGFAVVNLKNYKKPVLKGEPDYVHPAGIERDGSNGLLLVSSNSPTAPTPEARYEVVTIANPSNPTPLATIQGVFQRVDRPATGTIFLLSDQGRYRSTLPRSRDGTPNRYRQ